MVGRYHREMLDKDSRLPKTEDEEKQLERDRESEVQATMQDGCRSFTLSICGPSNLDRTFRQFIQAGLIGLMIEFDALHGKNVGCRQPSHCYKQLHP